MVEFRFTISLFAFYFFFLFCYPAFLSVFNCLAGNLLFHLKSNIGFLNAFILYYFLTIVLGITVCFFNLSLSAAAKLLQSCPTLCDPRDSIPPGSPVPGILQARTLEWVAIFFSNAGKWKVKVKSLSRVRPSATPWTAPYQAPPCMGFSRQEYWSGT